MPTLDPEQLLIREMREDEAPIVLELLKVRWRRNRDPAISVFLNSVEKFLYVDPY